MKRLAIIYGLLWFGLNATAQNKDVFQSPVDTDKKPWTNLEFYNDPDNFQFVIVSDRTGGNRPGIFEDAVGKINTLYPEFVLSVGDIIQGYTKDTAQIRREWEEANDIIGRLKMPYFYLPGNHDITNRIMAEEWEKRYGKRYYDFIYKNTLYIILDSNDDDEYNLTREQTDFAIAAIRDNPDVRWTFVLMHHPIWTYDTGGRFEEIESALKDRKYTVIAGHTHHYHYAERKDNNYYVLATTGGGSALRGHYFGEMDHITWVTMTDGGPVLVNLKLDGILKHDIANEETRKLAYAMMENTSLNHLLLCNEGAQFQHGTLYFHFVNNADQPLHLKLNFYHQHQLKIHQPMNEQTLAAGEEKIIPIEIEALAPISYEEVEALLIDWSLKYDLPEYPNFELSGKYDLPVTPTATSFLYPQTPQFIDKLKVSANHPFKILTTRFEINDTSIPNSDVSPDNSLQISETSDVKITIENIMAMSKRLYFIMMSINL